MQALLLRLWAAPVTVVGAALAAMARASGGHWRVVDGVIEAGGGAVGQAMRRWTRIEAITLGHVVIGTGAAALDRWRAHEHAHVRQYERWGPFMPLLYAGSSLRALLRGRHPYLHNAFEREARIVARRGRRSHLERRR